MVLQLTCRPHLVTGKDELLLCVSDLNVSHLAKIPAKGEILRDVACHFCLGLLLGAGTLLSLMMSWVFFSYPLSKACYLQELKRQRLSIVAAQIANKNKIFACNA